MATFVLVPGALSGSWYWRFVTPLLRAAGHDVFTPNLTGLGERAHLARPETDLDTHIQDIVNVLFYEDLRDVQLVGHSYGGFVISGVAERMPERIAQLVFLDALVPADGECLYDLAPGGAPWPGGDDWRSGVDTVENLRLENPAISQELAEWTVARYAAQPLGTWRQPVRLTNPAAAALPRAYIRCARTPWWSGARTEWLARPYTQSGWRVRELDTSHEAMLTQPRELAALLLELA